MNNLNKSSCKQAYLYIIKLLTKRDYSRFKLQTKLEAKGYEEEHIEIALNEVIQKGYLREDEYATARAKALMNKGIHPRLIENKLSEESVYISSDSINDLFNEYKITIEIQLRKLLNRKLHVSINATKEQFLDSKKEKLIRYCLSKGHEAEEVIQVLEEIIKEHS